jgi:tetratricopeptide (TPR) repeat protein
MDEVEEIIEEGEKLQKQGKHEQDEQLYRKAIALDAKNFEAWFGLGKVLVVLGKESEAKEALRKAAYIAGVDKGPYRFILNSELFDYFINFRIKHPDYLDRMEKFLHDVIQSYTDESSKKMKTMQLIYR